MSNCACEKQDRFANCCALKRAEQDRGMLQRHLVRAMREVITCVEGLKTIGDMEGATPEIVLRVTETLEAMGKLE